MVSLCSRNTKIFTSQVTNYPSKCLLYKILQIETRELSAWPGSRHSRFNRSVDSAVSSARQKVNMTSCLSISYAVKCKYMINPPSWRCWAPSSWNWRPRSAAHAGAISRLPISGSAGPGQTHPGPSPPGHGQPARPGQSTRIEPACPPGSMSAEGRRRSARQT